MRRTQLRHALLLAAMGAAYAGSASAAGFQLQNQTGSGNGNAFAGAAATAEDAGTIFFNPAGMTMLPDGHSFSVAGTVLSRSVKFTNDGSTSDSPVAPLVTTSNGKDAGGTTLIPAIYWSYALDKSLRLGLGISPTFGNTTDYGFDFIGRNAGYYAKITQLNVNPSIAFKVSEEVSLGFGLNYATNDTHFRQGYPITAHPTSALNAANDFVNIRGDAGAFGYNFGGIAQITPQTRLALTYRSELKFNLKGKYDVDVPVTAAGFVDQDIKAVLKTPASASLAISHKLNDELEILSDLTWTGWSAIKSLDITNASTGAAVASLSYNFRDAMRFGLGANYQYSDDLKLRVGTAYDQTPVRSPSDRTMTLPDSDRIWLAFGAKYSIDKQSSVDFGYAHIFFADASTARQVRSSSGTLLQTIRGSWNNSADLLSVQWNHNFK